MIFTVYLINPGDQSEKNTNSKKPHLSLSPTSAVHIHRLLACLAKFIQSEE